MARFQTDIVCCGLRELNGISDHRDPAKALREACGDDLVYTPYGKAGKLLPDNVKFSQAVFSQALSKGSKARTGYGDRLMAYIEDNGLGTVVRGHTNTNPNSGNRLTVFVWAINRPALVRWYNRQLSATDK